MRIYKQGQATRKRILEYIRQYWLTHGYAPAVRDIANHIGTTASNIHAHLGTLAREGEILQDEKTARSIRIKR
jgi:repressor LexA